MNDPTNALHRKAELRGKRALDKNGESVFNKTYVAPESDLLLFFDLPLSFPF
jgi:hypothetical protein